MNRLFSYGYLSLIYTLLYLPIVVLVIFSFNHANHSGLWHGATLMWYKQLWHDANLQTIAIHSLIIAFLASTSASFIGLLGAMALFRYRFFGKHLMYAVIFIMIILPDLVLAIAFLVLFHTLHIL
jgi:spermidine/putrescine transport system permease protein